MRTAATVAEMRLLPLLIVVAFGALACGGGARSAPPTDPAAAPESGTAAAGDDPHRKLTADECGSFYDFMKGKGWLSQPDAQREAVVAGCMEMGATQAFHQCIFGSATREEADRCQ